MTLLQMLTDLFHEPAFKMDDPIASHAFQMDMTLAVMLVLHIFIYGLSDIVIRIFHDGAFIAQLIQISVYRGSVHRYIMILKVGPYVLRRHRDALALLQESEYQRPALRMIFASVHPYHLFTSVCMMNVTKNVPPSSSTIIGPVGTWT